MYNSNDIYKKWYRVDEHEIANALSMIIENIARQNGSRRRDDELFMRMFGSYDIVGTGEDLPKWADERSLRYNLCRSATLTAQAHIGSLKPKPRVQTSDADWSLVKRARANEMVISSVFYQNDFYELATQAFLDASVSSIGGVMVYREDDKIKLERIFPGEILVDVKEGYYGKPRNIYRVKLIDRDLLKEQYPEKSFQIDQSGANNVVNLFGWMSHEYRENQILVIEAWHLGKHNPKTNKYDGGKHVISVGNGVLYSEPWDRKTFPMAFYRWETRQCGFYGRGIVEQLRTHQRTINYIDKRIRDMMHWLSRGKLVVWDNAQATVNIEHMTNHPQDIIRVQGTGQAPIVVNQNAVPTEWWHWRKETIESGYAEIGLNEMQTSGQKPPGIEAAAALREVQDAGAKRFRPKVQSFERFTVEVGKLIVQEIDAMAAAGIKPKFRVKYNRGAKTFLETIDWTEVALKDDEYRLEVTPASSLPDTTAGRKQTVEDWYRAGFISAMEARALLDFPDLERFDSLNLASTEIVLESIETMIEDGEQVIPEPTDDLNLIIKLTTQSLAKFRLRKAPEDRLELLRRYLDMAKHLIEKAQEQETDMQQQAGQIAQAVPVIQGALPGGASPQQAAQLMKVAG